MLATDLETASRRRLNATTSTFWSQAEIIEDCLYCAMMDMATRVKCIESTHTMPTVIGTTEYSYPTGVIELKILTYDGRKLELMPERQFFALQLNGFSTTVTGDPTHYFIWEQSLFLYPTPNAVKTLSLRTVDEATRPVSPYNAVLGIPSKFHSRLVNGVAYYMLLKETTDPRISIFASQWENDLIRSAGEWRRSKAADKFSRVRLEEESPTTDTGVV